VWDDLAAATKLTSVSLDFVKTTSPADVMSALTALPDLQQLTWACVVCDGDELLSDSLLLKQLTRLTALQLEDVTAEALEHLSSLNKLQHLSLSCSKTVRSDITNVAEWAAAGSPGLQELKALTRLELYDVTDIPDNVSQLTALQQLTVSDTAATLTALNRLQVLPDLTQLCVQPMKRLSAESPPLQLSGLQHLELDGRAGDMPMSFLSSCTQLQVLCVSNVYLVLPGRLVASNLLQHLELKRCRVSAADGAAGPVSWQQLVSAVGQLPHLTSLALRSARPTLQQADIECVVECCTRLQVLHLDTLQDGCASTLTRLSGLTSLALDTANDQQCSSLAELTGLRELRVDDASQVSAAGLRQLAALEELTSLGFLYYTSKFGPVLQEQLSDELLGCSHAIISKVRSLSFWGGGS